MEECKGGYRVSAPCFGQMTSMVKGLAGGKVILALEGGYNMENTSEALASCLSTLLGDPCAQLPPLTPNMKAVECIGKVMEVHKQYWKSLQYRTSLPVYTMKGEENDMDTSKS